MIAIDLDNREYQPMAPYPARDAKAPRTPALLAASAAGKESVEAALRAAGFRPYEENPALSGWYCGDLVAAIVVDNDGSNTIGVSISRSSVAEYVTHRLNGTYDGLPTEEKHRLSGAGGTIESWLSRFDKVGEPRT